MKKYDKVIGTIIWVFIVIALICGVMSQSNNNIIGKEFTYWSAVKEYDKGSIYSLNKFVRIKEHRNSKEYIYAMATKLFNNGDYVKAKEYYSEIEEYKDSKTLVGKCDDEIMTRSKEEARALAIKLEKDIKEREKQEAQREVEIANAAPYIGMSEEDLKKCAWSKDVEDINVTVSEYGTSKQYCYKGYKYVYIEDGKVTTIQK